jgi:hypothetical protein
MKPKTMFLKMESPLDKSPQEEVLQDQTLQKGLEEYQGHLRP